MSVNTQDTPTDANGGLVLGTTTPVIAHITKTTVRDGKTVKKEETTAVTGNRIVLYEKNIRAAYESSDKITMGFYDRTMFVMFNNFEDIVAGAAVHEAAHATDPKSQRVTNPNAPIKDIEKKPLDDQEQFFIENIIKQ